jgi:hypothetical protein
MVLEREIVINTNIEAAWQVLGPQFPYAFKWASAVNHSEGKGDSLNGSTCSERGCETVLGKLKEKLLTYSAENYLLSYELAEGMPSMVNYATNTWRLISLDSNKTVLRISINFRFRGLAGILMQPMLKIQLSRLGKHLLEEFKYYVESGKPHSRKIKAMKKYEATQFKAA